MSYIQKRLAELKANMPDVKKVKLIKPDDMDLSCTLENLRRVDRDALAFQIQDCLMSVGFGRCRRTRNFKILSQLPCFREFSLKIALCIEMRFLRFSDYRLAINRIRIYVSGSDIRKFLHELTHDYKRFGISREGRIYRKKELYDYAQSLKTLEIERICGMTE